MSVFEGRVQCPHHPDTYSRTLLALVWLPQIQRSWETEKGAGRQRKVIVFLWSPPALGLSRISLFLPSSTDFPKIQGWDRAASQPVGLRWAHWAALASDLTQGRGRLFMQGNLGRQRVLRL